MPTKIQDPTPEWMKSKNASVLDPAWLSVARWISQKLGGTDPESQITGLAAGVETTEAKTLLDRLSRGLKSFKAYKDFPVSGQALGSLANTIDPRSGKEGIYTLQNATKDRVADIYHLLGKRVTSNWEGAGNIDILGAFAGDREKALQWARMWGATSPNTSTVKNTRESISALIHLLENPDVPFTEDMARELAHDKITMAGSKFGNLNKAVAGETLSPDTKAEAMAGYMAGDPRLPVDVHALFGVGSTATKFDPEIPALRTLMTSTEGLKRSGGLTNPQIYKRYEGALRRALEEIEPGVDVNPVFSTFWDGSQVLKGRAPASAPIDILRQKGLLEYGAMLDPRRLKAALAEGGWSAKAIAGLGAAIGSLGISRESSAAEPQKPGLEPVPGAPPPPPEDDPSWYREDGSLKGHGYLGDFQTGFPGGPQGVASEYSVAQRLKTPEGKWMDYPSLVPGMTPDEITKTMWAVNTGHAVPPSVGKKAEAHALQRISQGRSVWADTRESPLRIGDQVIPQPPLAVSHQQPGLVPVDPNEVMNPNDMPGMAGVPLWLIPR
jgi:hypothetical protein